jgi:PPOX class probable F420-dependent enzyme
VDKKLQARLKRELVVWFVTADRATAKPQSVPVWFLWDDDSFLIYSAPGIKERHVRSNPHVELHFNSDPAADEVVRASGKARIVKSEPPADKVPVFIRKYGDQIKGFGWTPSEFARRYPHPIRVREVRFH